MELYSNNARGSGDGSWTPLAERMRPKVLDEFVGQEHILGPGRFLRTLIEQQTRITGLENACRGLAERLRRIAEEPQTYESGPEDDTEQSDRDE